MAIGCDIWDSRTARVPPCALITLSYGPAITIVLICIGNLAQPFFEQYRPEWTKPFVQEQPPGHGELRTGAETRSLKGMNALFLLALTGMCAHIATMPNNSLSLSVLVLPAPWAIIVFLIMISDPRSRLTTWLIFYAVEMTVKLAFMTSGVAESKLYFVCHGVIVVASFASILVIINMPIKQINLSNDKVSVVGSSPSQQHQSPEDNLTIWQFLTVSWLAPILALGPRRALKDEDVWSLPYQFQHTRLHEQFQKLRGFVLSRILRANIIDLFMVSLIGILRLAGDYSLPLILQQLLKAMESPDRSIRVILTYALFSFCARVFSAQMRTLGYWYSRRCYERSRGEMITLIYDKALTRKNVIGTKVQYLAVPNEIADVSKGNDNGYIPLSRWSRFLNIFSETQKPVQIKEYASTGKILHLIRGDVDQVSQRLRDVDQLINVPAGIVMACALVWKILGPSCFLGLIVVLLSQGLNMYFTKILFRFKRRQKVSTDARIQATVQFIEVIRHLRWYGWQNHWFDQVLKARTHELRTKARAMALSVGITNTDILGRNLFPVVALYSYTYLAGNRLSIDMTFPALQSFQKLDETLRSIPRLISESVSAYIALGRIEDFITEPDKEQEHSVASPNNLINLDRCDFAWPGQSEPCLRDINIEIEPGLTVIHGNVGAGKSALLHAILGELDKLKGETRIPNLRIGYCCQTPWLQSISIRDNILFNEPFEEARYQRVTEACQLVPDFGVFKHGDLSVIGENGIGLSGGQRARVALARAVYGRANIVLLDDPFSALDYKTARSIVQDLFQGPLFQNRTIVLVTHRIDLVYHLTSQVIEVIDGRAEVLNPNAIGSRLGDGLNVESAADFETDPYIQKPGTSERFLKDEKIAEWGIPLRVNWTFIKAGGLRWWAATVFFSAAFYVSSLCCAWFLKAWGEAYKDTGLSLAKSQMQLLTSGKVKTSPLLLSKWRSSSLFDGYPSPIDDVRPWLWTYFAISIVQLVQVGYSVTEIIIGRRASTFLFQKSLDRVSRATFRYYDVTPLGQLMNRFTSDMSTVDGKVTFHTRRLALAAVGWSIYLSVIACITPSFMIFCLIIMVIYSSIFLRYFLTSQSLRRLHTASVSPLFTHFGELVQGLTTIRAFHSGTHFQRQLISILDKFQGMDHFFWSALAWFMYRIELITAVSALALTVVAVLTGLPPSLTAFMLSTVNGFIGSTHMLSRVYGELQMEFISVERVEELFHIKQENPGTIQPSTAWPRFGAEIILDNVSVRYADHLDPVLKNINLRIPGGSMVALVGRTGSGKSTLAQALIGVIRPHIGKILIDNLSVDEVDINTLRQRVTFVAQDPILFFGTIRHNLDPVEQYSDDECGAVLNRICLDQGWTLTTKLESGGQNLSQGQRQLIGIARAVLRRSPIVILDEATASIDAKTSISIQQILRDEMTESTVIMIAHRIEAVKNVDYAIVMENGSVLRHGPAIHMLE